MSLVSPTKIVSTKQAKRREKTTHHGSLSGQEEDATSMRTTTTTRTKTIDSLVTRATSSMESYDNDEFLIERTFPGLSKEAIYRTKIKYGMYYSPARPSKEATNYRLATGSASHLLAEIEKREHAKDLELHAEREPSMQAQLAAGKIITKLLAEEGNEHPKDERKYKKRTDGKFSHLAASKVLSQDEHIIQKAGVLPKPKSYVTTTSTNAASSLGKNPTKKIASSTPIEISRKLNLSKVLTGAEYKARERFHERWNPNEAKIERIRLAERGYPIAVASHLQQLNQEAMQQSSMTVPGPPHYDITEATKVFNMAQVKTSQDLYEMDRARREMELYNNVEYNKIAITKATEQHSQKQNVQNKQAISRQGKVNLGGGLWVPEEDVDKLAHERMDPVLVNVDKVARREREVDYDIERRAAIVEQEYLQWRELQGLKETNDHEILDSVVTNNDRDKWQAQRDAQVKFDQLVSEKEQEIDMKGKQLQELEARHMHIKGEFDTRLETEQENLSKELKNWVIDNETDLSTIKAERGQLLKQYHDEMKRVDFNTAL
ncbi:hypothetical protein NCAS_0H03040 [Naumovozyma castellii]|uniref:Uncharacterized protein n=1 Tax=Naumovozyma castellii TaxID=27288 RepID=G0VJD5_NAUCA|nr:hypothetical protein NCAS_0H03040 [Naumovozyma castellii CBS 4309]CCC71614.1 hypothetical protein NCAS_0H03040 [Naumovozyma castellii CBS 4309]